MRWTKVIDNARCIGCQACSVACKSEHEVPIGVYRTYVKQVEVGVFPAVERHFQVTRCNQCDDPPCVESCPVTAMFQRPDGIVDFDRSICLGCKACIAACPYDAIYINPNNHSAEKCNFCAHRIDQGLQPACVTACPTQAIVIGDSDDAESPIGRYLASGAMQVRRPEKATNPKLYYNRADASTLLPLATLGSAAGMFSQPAPVAVLDRPEHGPQPQAAALLGYSTVQRAPWDWKVSAYTWTKSLAAGSFLLLAAAELVIGRLPAAWEWSLLVVSLAFLAATGALLVTHLGHPERFWLILARPQWRSWLARGAYLMTVFGALSAVAAVALLAGLDLLIGPLMVAGALFALGTAVFTAMILQQSKGRDLWQNPVLPAHLAVQAGVAGASAGALLAVGLPAAGPLAALITVVLAVALVAHLALGGYEAFGRHGTPEARLGAFTLTRARWSTWYWGALAGGGLMPLAITVVAPALLPVAAVLALAGLFMYEHAYLQAGQSVPLR